MGTAKWRFVIQRVTNCSNTFIVYGDCKIQQLCIHYMQVLNGLCMQNQHNSNKTGNVIQIRKKSRIGKMQMRLEIDTSKKQTILEALRERGIDTVPTPCGGRGRCGKCSVHVEGQERDVLACVTEVKPGMVVTIPDEKGAGQIAEDSSCVHYAPDDTDGLVAACDLGTTTVVCHLVDGKTGQILATISEANAQKSYGADVISRMQAAGEGKLRELQEQVTGQLSGMLKKLLDKVGADEAVRLAVAGNTLMCHLLAGISPEAIGKPPFLPMEYFGKTIRAKEIGVQGCREVYIAPSVSGYVGGDITADLLAVTPGHGEEETLLLDIGTNGEMALGKKGDYVCLAAAAGPAFEGAQIEMGMPAKEGAISHVYLDQRRIRLQVIGETKATGICGSGLLDALAVFLKLGLMEKDGRIREQREVSVACRKYLGEYKNDACIYLAEEVCVTQEDIRNLQLAKGAIAAGIEILFRERSLTYEDVDRLVLAGGFGSYLTPESAAAVGLIPRELLPVTESVGNAAGAGAVSAAVSHVAREELTQIQKGMRYLELSSHPDFQELYIQHMNF